MDLGPHADFIVAAYGIAVAGRRGADRLGRCSIIAPQKRKLAERLEARGITRRSERTVETAA